MRSMMKIAAVAAALFVSAPVGEAQAFGWCRENCPPAGWGTVRPIKHWVYYPRYAHQYNVHSTTDPFAYHSRAVRYYPGTSQYWSHHYHPQRADFALPSYHPAWGYERPYVRTKTHHAKVRALSQRIHD
jgi:hypothetical protein